MNFGDSPKKVQRLWEPSTEKVLKMSQFCLFQAVVKNRNCFLRKTENLRKMMKGTFSRRLLGKNASDFSKKSLYYCGSRSRGSCHSRYAAKLQETWHCWATLVRFKMINTTIWRWGLCISWKSLEFLLIFQAKTLKNCILKYSNIIFQFFQNFWFSNLCPPWPIFRQNLYKISFRCNMI